jgi:hypothetical protein
MLALIRFAAQSVVHKGINQRWAVFIFQTTLTGKFDGEGGGKENRFRRRTRVDPKQPLLTVCPLHRILRFVRFPVFWPVVKVAQAHMFCLKIFPVTDFERRETE